ncbi:hypothetical protein F511_24929 [Dorcoceras hygrometricum]|uniref:Uncharacterized protein n=1 Tax=Dorcoceras hygrometricum TaxID=472368 RepID=A0A2Z7ASN4_9LAMI|nr:hypothetical protein F511_24929 [Dorcoceras hygrometricum]
MSNVEQEADNSKRKSEESDVVLKNQQMVRVQQMATEEWIQQKRKDKDSADGFALRISSRGKSSRKHLKPTTGQPAASISLPPAGQPDASNSTSSPQFKWRKRQRSLQKKGHKDYSLSVLYKTHLNGKNVVSNGLKLYRGFIYKGSAIEEELDVVRPESCCRTKNKINRRQQQRENESEVKLSTTILERA